MNQLLNAEVNGGNRKVVLASNYATRIRGRHPAFRECILYKQLNYTRTLIHSDTRSNAKVGECVVGVVLRGCQSPKLRPVYLPRTSVFFFPRVVLSLNKN